MHFAIAVRSSQHVKLLHRGLIQFSFPHRLEKKRKILNLEYRSDLFLIALVGDVLFTVASVVVQYFKTEGKKAVFEGKL